MQYRIVKTGFFKLSTYYFRIYQNQHIAVLIHHQHAAPDSQASTVFPSQLLQEVLSSAFQFSQILCQ